MAVISLFETRQGFTVDDAYVHVVFASVNAREVFAHAVAFASAEARKEGKPPIDAMQFNFAPDLGDGAPNLWKQAYAVLKALPGFSGATDV